MLSFDLDRFRAWLEAQPPEASVGSTDWEDNPIVRWQSAIGGPLDSVSGCDYGIWGGTWVHDAFYQGYGIEGVEDLPW